MRKILIVDDEEDIIELVSDLIDAQIENVEIKTAINGKIALDIAKEDRFDLIITDHKMPVMTGHSFINELKQQKTINEKTPIILNSAFLSEIDETGSLEGVEIVDKGIDINKLIEYVSDVLDK